MLTCVFINSLMIFQSDWSALQLPSYRFSVQCCIISPLIVVNFKYYNSKLNFAATEDWIGTQDFCVCSFQGRMSRWVTWEESGYLADDCSKCLAQRGITVWGANWISERHFSWLTGASDEEMLALPLYFFCMRFYFGKSVWTFTITSVIQIM